MGRKTVRSAAASCPRCAALIAGGTSRCGICHFDLTTPTPDPVVEAPQAEQAPETPVDVDAPTEMREDAASVAGDPLEVAPVVAPAAEEQPDAVTPAISVDDQPTVVEPAPQPADAIDQTTPLTVPPEFVDTTPEAPAIEPEPEAVAVEPESVAVEPEPVAVEPEPVAPAPAPAPFTPGAAGAAPAYVGGVVRSTKGVRQALTVVVIMAAVTAALSQVLLWFAARQVGRTFEQAFTLDSNGQFDATAAEATLRGGAFAASLAGLSAIGWMLLTVATVVLFLVWHAQANANARALTGRTPRFGTAPALICWFVPLANLVIPWLNLNDIWKTTGGSSATRSTGRGTNLVIAWWVAIGGQVVLALVNGVPSRTVEIDTSPLGPLALAQTALYIASVVLMLMTVRAIGSMQESGAAAPASPPMPPPSPFEPAPQPTPFGAPAEGRVLVAPATVMPASAPPPAAAPAAPNPPINPRDPFSWGAAQPPPSTGPTFR